MNGQAMGRTTLARDEDGLAPHHASTRGGTVAHRLPTTRHIAGQSGGLYV